MRAQSFDDWELLIADDGSTDATPAVLARHGGDPRIRLLPGAHGERCVARNRALRGGPWRAGRVPRHRRPLASREARPPDRRARGRRPPPASATPSPASSTPRIARSPHPQAARRPGRRTSSPRSLRGQLRDPGLGRRAPAGWCSTRAGSTRRCRYAAARTGTSGSALRATGPVVALDDELTLYRHPGHHRRRAASRERPRRPRATLRRPRHGAGRRPLARRPRAPACAGTSPARWQPTVAAPPCRWCWRPCARTRAPRWRARRSARWPRSCCRAPPNARCGGCRYDPAARPLGAGRGPPRRRRRRLADRAGAGGGAAAHDRRPRSWCGISRARSIPPRRHAGARRSRHAPASSARRSAAWVRARAPACSPRHRRGCASASTSRPTRCSPSPSGCRATGKRDRTRSAVRFAVVVDGDELWSRTINPATLAPPAPLVRRAHRRRALRRAQHRSRAGHRGGVARPAALRARRLGRRAPGPRGTHRARQQAPPDRPNVLVLLVDTLRADGLGVYGATPSPSPNLDHLRRHRASSSSRRWRRRRGRCPRSPPLHRACIRAATARSERSTRVPTTAAWGFLADARRHDRGARNAAPASRPSACPPTPSCHAARTWPRASSASTSCRGATSDVTGRRRPRSTACSPTGSRATATGASSPTCTTWSRTTRTRRRRRCGRRRPRHAQGPGRAIAFFFFFFYWLSIVVLADGRGEDARADVRDAGELQEALEGAVLAVRAVQHGEDDVDLAQGLGNGARLGVDDLAARRVRHREHDGAVLGIGELLAIAKVRIPLTVEGITEYRLDNGLQVLLFPDRRSRRSR